MAEKFIMPKSSPVDENGRLRMEWQKYLSGVEVTGKRLNGIADLAGGASLADVIAKVNAILTAYQTE